MKAAICTQCGAGIEVDEHKETGYCSNCGTKFVTEKVIHNNIVQHIDNSQNTYIVTGDKQYSDFDSALKGKTVEDLRFVSSISEEEGRRMMLIDLADDRNTPPDIIGKSEFGKTVTRYKEIIRISAEVEYDWSARIGIDHKVPRRKMVPDGEGGQREEIKDEVVTRWSAEHGVYYVNFSKTLVPGKRDKDTVKLLETCLVRYPTEAAEGKDKLAMSDEDIRSFKKEADAAGEAEFRSRQPGDRYEQLSARIKYRNMTAKRYFIPEYSLDYSYNGTQHASSISALDKTIQKSVPEHKVTVGQKSKDYIIKLILMIALLAVGVVLAIVGSQTGLLALSYVGVGVVIAGAVAAVLFFTTRKKMLDGVAEKNKEQKRRDLKDIFGIE